MPIQLICRNRKNPETEIETFTKREMLPKMTQSQILSDKKNLYKNVKQNP